MSAVNTSGFVAPGWEAVRAAFEQNLSSGEDVGAGATIYHRGQLVVDVTGGAEARDLTAQLRAAGIGCDRAFDQKGMRAQMKAADRSGAALAVIVGEQEVADGVVTIRPLRHDFGGDQTTVPRSDVIGALTSLIAKEQP